MCDPVLLYHLFRCAVDIHFRQIESEPLQCEALRGFGATVGVVCAQSVMDPIRVTFVRRRWNDDVIDRGNNKNSRDARDRYRGCQEVAYIKGCR